MISWSSSFAMEVLAGIRDNMMSWIATYGYPGVFAVALLETIFPPIPSELIFLLVGFTAYSENLGIGHAIGMATAGALGSTLGGIIIYYIASKVGRPTILRYGTGYFRINESSIQRAELWFERYGKTVVFLGRMAPGIREIISIPAGISKMNLIEFIMFTFLGSLTWSVALTLVGYYTGQAWEQYSEQLSFIFSVGAIVIVVGVAVWLGIRYYYYSSLP